MMIVMYIAIAIPVLMIAAIPFIILSEKREFNHGICPRCGRKLRHFDDDSQGGQGWKCDTCKKIIWISWINGEKEVKKHE